MHSCATVNQSLGVATKGPTSDLVNSRAHSLSACPPRPSRPSAHAAANDEVLFRALHDVLLLSHVIVPMRSYYAPYAFWSFLHFLSLVSPSRLVVPANANLGLADIDLFSAWCCRGAKARQNTHLYPDMDTIPHGFRPSDQITTRGRRH